MGVLSSTSRILLFGPFAALGFGTVAGISSVAFINNTVHFLPRGVKRKACQSRNHVRFLDLWDLLELNALPILASGKFFPTIDNLLTTSLSADEFKLGAKIKGRLTAINWFSRLFAFTDLRVKLA